MTNHSLFHIVPIVEGHGDVEALPILIRRMANQIGLRTPEIAKPIRIPKNSLMKSEELGRSLKLAYLKMRQPGGIIILVDADDDCPKDLGPRLLKKAQELQGNIPISVVVATKEFEAWFLASIVSLRGIRGIHSNAEPPDNPENIRGAKEYLTNLMRGDLRYSPRVDQPVLTENFDIPISLRKCPSLDKFRRELEKLLGTLI